MTELFESHRDRVIASDPSSENQNPEDFSTANLDGGRHSSFCVSEDIISEILHDNLRIQGVCACLSLVRGANRAVSYGGGGSCLPRGSPGMHSLLLSVPWQYQALARRIMAWRALRIEQLLTRSWMRGQFFYSQAGNRRGS
jgi:hypothetical protein